MGSSMSTTRRVFTADGPPPSGGSTPGPKPKSNSAATEAPAPCGRPAAHVSGGFRPLA